jgi:hypothetical protein
MYTILFHARANHIKGNVCCRFKAGRGSGTAYYDHPMDVRMGTTVPH